MNTPKDTENTSEENAGCLLARKPWLLVLLAFALLISGLSIVLTLAIKNYPEEVVIPQSSSNK